VLSGYQGFSVEMGRHKGHTKEIGSTSNTGGGRVKKTKEHCDR